MLQLSPLHSLYSGPKPKVGDEVQVLSSGETFVIIQVGLKYVIASNDKGEKMLNLRDLIITKRKEL